MIKTIGSRIRNWIHFRRERRRAMRRATLNAQLMVIGGTITVPKDKR